MHVNTHHLLVTIHVIVIVVVAQLLVLAFAICQSVRDLCELCAWICLKIRKKKENKKWYEKELEEEEETVAEETEKV